MSEDKIDSCYFDFVLSLSLVKIQAYINIIMKTLGPFLVFFMHWLSKQLWPCTEVGYVCVKCSYSERRSKKSHYFIANLSLRFSFVGQQKRPQRPSRGDWVRRRRNKTANLLEYTLQQDLSGHEDYRGE